MLTQTLSFECELPLLTQFLPDKKLLVLMDLDIFVGLYLILAFPQTPINFTSSHDILNIQTDLVLLRNGYRFCIETFLSLQLLNVEWEFCHMKCV